MSKKTLDHLKSLFELKDKIESEIDKTYKQAHDIEGHSVRAIGKYVDVPHQTLFYRYGSAPSVKKRRITRSRVGKMAKKS